MNPTRSPLTRAGAAGCLAASGLIHAQLYLHGYRTIPGIGPAFLLQASGALAVAVLLLVTAAAVPRLAAAALAVGALGGFAASRTVGIFGFVEHGLQPAPQALVSVVTEVAALGLLALPLVVSGRDATSVD
ncbi:MAG TPA: hypothetical protein VE673_17180 [Pseudonocardiaceae bacterium]|nr:hypothetical protein [Pseudonocardiaceae bacterium]